MQSTRRLYFLCSKLIVVNLTSVGLFATNIWLGLNVMAAAISDDDRMSLTTAVSDEDDGESVMASPYKAKATGTAASSFNCTGAVRKAGFLSVKKWLLRKKHQIELARKRGWKGYWVCLKGTTLLFYPCDSREGRSVEAAPKHLIIVDGAIMQPIPEHPKRDYIFCLSTAFGDAYLFQAPCQVELENWVNSIHSACAAAFARHRGKTGTLHLLQEEIFRLEKAIESLRHKIYYKLFPFLQCCIQNRILKLPWGIPLIDFLKYKLYSSTKSQLLVALKG
ncbi:unnamed protein product [Ceratitis capitata]|uniref:(Mediterranean fruit fly) hypothetical protein n=1 Tax=Ceratitis capitata TaxID=7213 RepID=A0A811V0B7_CERCA|nr:unnamed protein product [Ceratitis capitata]